LFFISNNDITLASQTLRLAKQPMFYEQICIRGDCLNRNAEESEYLLSWSCNAGIREAIQKFGQSAAGQERYRLTQMVKETAKPEVSIKIQKVCIGMFCLIKSETCGILWDSLFHVPVTQLGSFDLWPRKSFCFGCLFVRADLGPFQGSRGSNL